MTALQTTEADAGRAPGRSQAGPHPLGGSGAVLDDRGAAIVLGPELTIAYAAAVRDTLVTALAACEDSDLLLDLGGVTDFDSSGVQLLLSARLSQHSRGHQLRLVASSPAVRDALLTFGLADLLARVRAD